MFFYGNFILFRVFHFGSKTCICISIWVQHFNKPTHPVSQYSSSIIKALPMGICFTVSISWRLCTAPILRWLCRIDDLAVLFYYRAILWRLCRIDDSAVLMILPYCSVYNFTMETTLPYWGLCRIVLHHAFSAVHSFVNVSEASLALRDSLLVSAGHCPY